MNDPLDDRIDWSLTTREDSWPAQLRRALTLTLRKRMEAVESLADVARRFKRIHESGGCSHNPHR